MFHSMKALIRAIFLPKAKPLSEVEESRWQVRTALHRMTREMDEVGHNVHHCPACRARWSCVELDHLILCSVCGCYSPNPLKGAQDDW